MDQSDKNKIDSLFRENLAFGGRQPDFVEEEWEMMEGLLGQDPVKKNNIIWLYRLAAGVAAGLLLFIGTRFAVKTIDNEPQMAVESTQTDSIGSVAAAPNKSSHQNAFPALKNSAKQDTVIALNYVVKIKNSKKEVSPLKREPTPISVLSDTGVVQTSITIANAIQGNTDTPVADANLVSNTAVTANTQVIADTPIATSPIIKTVIPAKQRAFSGPRVTLAILAAPDVNGVNSFKGAQTGGNFSVQASVKLTSKLSFTTGAAYAIKPYQTAYGNYRSANPAWWRMMWASKPQDVAANCKVLDIPLNLDYQLFKKGGNDFSVGAGVSSYLMLNERYSFAFADASVAPAQLQVSNRNQHLFGVFNIQATYQHKLNSRFGLLVQPYAKLPFSRIGLGQVNLKSAGVAVGFNWNIHSFNNK